MQQDDARPPWNNMVVYEQSLKTGREMQLACQSHVLKNEH